MSAHPAEAGGSAPPHPRRRFWLRLAILTFVLVFAGALVVDRRGVRMLPLPTSAASPAPALTPSTVSLEVRYDLSDVLEALEDRAPVRFGDPDERHVHPENPALTYALALEREPLQAELRGDTVHLTALVHYQGRVWLVSPFGGELRASCGYDRPRPRAVVRFSTPVRVRPDWSVATHVGVEDVRAASESGPDRCEVALGPWRMDVTDRLLTAARRRAVDFARELDAMAARLDARSTVEAHWARIQEPMRLDEGVWLRVEPDSVRLGAVEARGSGGHTLVARVALVGRPRISVGARPDAGDVPLPPLVEGPVDDRFAAVVDTRIDYVTASRLASDAFRDHELALGRQILRVAEVRMSAAGEGRLAVDIDVEGAARGRVRLVGTPSLDPTTGDVTVTDLRFAVETRNLLLRGAAWLLRGTVAGRIRDAVRWNVDEAVETARTVADESLRRPVAEGVRVDASLGPVEVVGLHVTDQGILVRSRIESALRLRIPSSNVAQRSGGGSAIRPPRRTEDGEER